MRLLTASAFIFFGMASVRQAPPLTTLVLEIISIGAGVCLLVGLWTPVVGTLAVVVKLLIAYSRYSSHSGDAGFPIIHAVLAAILAMVGPGAWSIDARLFGRKRIDFPER